MVDSLFTWRNLQAGRLNVSPERNPLYLIFKNVCVLLRVPACVTSRVYARCASAYRHILLTHPLNNKKDTLDHVFVGQWRFLLPQNSNTPTMHLNTPRFQTNTPMGAQMGTSAFAI